MWSPSLTMLPTLLATALAASGASPPVSAGWQFVQVRYKIDGSDKPASFMFSRRMAQVEY